MTVYRFNFGQRQEINNNFQILSRQETSLISVSLFQYTKILSKFSPISLKATILHTPVQFANQIIEYIFMFTLKSDIFFSTI